MQTKFSPAQLADPHIETANGILRACVHCGFCTATCPTYVLLGDELDSPRGRIYLIKDMLENERPASAKLVKHVDRCLSCLACMTTCPSGVDYMHLVDHARTRIAETYVRPWPERLLRTLLAVVLPRPGLFRLALIGARLARPFKGLFPGRLKGLVAMAREGAQGGEGGLRIFLGERFVLPLGDGLMLHSHAGGPAARSQDKVGKPGRPIDQRPRSVRRRRRSRRCPRSRSWV